jgi:16S rRNA processing protein RimM
MGTGPEHVADDTPAEAASDAVLPGASRPSGPADGIGSVPPIPKEPVFLIVARVMRPHGTQGEIGCEIITEFPERFRRTRRVFLAPTVPGKLEARPGVAPREFSVEQARLSNHRGRPEVILKLGGVTDRDTAESLRGLLVQVPEAEAWKLPRGRFYWHQILGLRVVTTEGEEIGTVAEILETGANDVYVVKSSSGGERLIPAITQVVKWINPARGEILIELLPGL